jgi:hypothetical protein
MMRHAGVKSYSRQVVAMLVRPDNGVLPAEAKRIFERKTSNARERARGPAGHGAQHGSLGTSRKRRLAWPCHRNAEDRKELRGINDKIMVFQKKWIC